MRYIGLVVQSLWLTYALLSHNISSAVGNVVLILSAPVGIIRTMEDRKREPKTAPADKQKA